jgi:hypothetical protein
MTPLTRDDTDHNTLYVTLADASDAVAAVMRERDQWRQCAERLAAAVKATLAEQWLLDPQCDEDNEKVDALKAALADFDRLKGAGHAD